MGSIMDSHRTAQDQAQDDIIAYDDGTARPLARPSDMRRGYRARSEPPRLGLATRWLGLVGAVLLVVGGLGTMPAAAQTLSTIAVSPTSSVGGGAIVVGTATLSGAAPSGGTTVTLSSSNTAAASVPASVVVPQGATSATFDVVTAGVASSTSVTITGTLSATNKTATLTVTAAAISAVTLNQTSAVGGAFHPTGTVALTGKAPSGGTTITLSSSATSRATVPASIVVPQGSTTASFSATTLPVASSGSTTLTGTLSGTNKTVSLLVTPSVAAYQVTLSQSSAKGGSVNPVGTVVLSAPAPAGGSTVTLTSSNTAAATVPANVVVPAGASSANFTITTLSVAANATPTITAAFGGQSPTAALTVTPSTVNDRVTLFVPSVIPAGTSTGTAFLNGPAPAGGASVSLSSSVTSTATVSPSSITIPAGASSGTFTVTGQSVTSTKSATITATYSGSAKTSTITVTPAARPASITYAPANSIGGTTAVATLLLNAAAPAGGLVVSIVSTNSSVATAPTSVTVPAGSTSTTFNVTTAAVANTTGVTINASSGGTTASGSLTVATPTPSSVSLNPTSVAYPVTSTATLTISGVAPTGGAVVNLASSATTVATVPASVTVAAGQTTTTFTVSSQNVASSGTSTITATRAGTSTTASITVNPAPPALSSISLNPAAVTGGSASTATASLTAAAPSGGAAVTLSSSNAAAATVPASVTIPQGQTSATFSVSSSAVATQQTSTITGTYGVAKAATLTVNPPQLSSLSLNPTTVTGGATSAGSAVLTGPAPTGGIAVALSSSNTGAVTAPASVTVAAGQTTATFTATSLGVSTQQSATITGTLGVPRTAVLTVDPAQLASLSLNPTTVTAGQTSTGTASLNGAAGPGGTTITLASSNTSAATTPASVIVPQGQSSIDFTVTSLSVPSDDSSEITATLGGTSQSATLTVLRAQGSVTGTIVDAQTGFGLPGVSVFLTSDPGQSTGTDYAGSYLLTNVVAGNHTVTASRGGYENAVSSTLVVTAGGTTTVPALSLAPQASTITGVLIDPDNASAPLVGATVTLGRTGAQTTTDATGRFTFTGVPPGEEFLAYTKTGFRPSLTGTLRFGPNTSFDLGQAGLYREVASFPTGLLQGTVRDSAGSPIAGVTIVALGGPTTTTSAAGTYSLTLPLGSYYVVATKSGYRTAHSAYHVGAGYFATNWQIRQDFTLATTSETTTLDLTTTNPVLLTPAPGDVVLTGRGGHYTVGMPASATRSFALPPGSYTASDVPPLNFAPNATFALNADAPPTLPTTSPVWAISGVLRDQATALPVSGASVTFTNSGASYTTTMTTNSQGRFSLSGGTGGAPVGDYTLSIVKTGYQPVPPFNFTAAENAYHAPRFTLNAIADDGSLAIDSPAAGATLTQDVSTILCNATLPVADDYIVNAQVSLQGGDVLSQAYTYAQDGRHFEIALSSLSPNGPLTITVDAITRRGVLLHATRQVTLSKLPGVSVIDVSPSTLVGGSSGSGSVTLSLPAGAGGQEVTFTATGAVTAPAPITIPEGQSSAGFFFTTTPVAATTASSLTATLNGISKTASITVTPPIVTALTVSPGYVNPAGSTTGTVTISSNAPAGGLVVSLSSSNSAAITVPSTMTIAAGSTTGTFTATVPATAPTAVVTLTATANGGSAQTTVDVDACVVPAVSAPTDFNPADVVWFDDALPAGANSVNFVWDTTQKASGTQSHTDAGSAGSHLHYFQDATDRLYVAQTDKLVVYVLLDPCRPPQEIMLEFRADNAWERRAFWGADLIEAGTFGTESRRFMGPLPVVGQWARLEIPAADVGLGGRELNGVDFVTYGGRAWFDRFGKLATCAAPTAPAPDLTGFASDVVWFDDAVPSGAVADGFVWDTAQKASGTKSHTDTPTAAAHQHSFYGAASRLYLSPTDRLFVYALLDLCDPPREIMLEFHDDSGWEHRAFWGADLIERGTPGTASRHFRGDLPPTGQWVRLDFPVADVGLVDRQLNGVSFVAYGGKAWYDRVGKSRVDVPTLTLTVSPTSLSGGGQATATVTLGHLATANTPQVTLQSSHPSIAPVPAAVTIPQGGTTATFTIDTAAVAVDTAATLTATYDYVSATANLNVVAAGLTSVSVSPSSVRGGNPSTGTVLLSSPAVTPLLVTLASSNAVAIIQPNVTIAAGQTSATFQITTTAVGTATSVDITATVGGVSRTATLTLTSCTPTTAQQPTGVVIDAMWADDTLPTSAMTVGSWTWDNAQAAAGTRSHTSGLASGVHFHGFENGPLQYMGSDDLLEAYVLLDPCDPPREIMIEWFDGGWEHRAFWGEDLITRGVAGTAGHVNKGALPQTGVWMKLELPASEVDLARRNVRGVAFWVYDGRAWFDLIGKRRAPTTPQLTGMTIAANRVVATRGVSGTFTLSAPATENLVLTVTSSVPGAASTWALAQIPVGQTTMPFDVQTFAIAEDTPVTLTTTFDSISRSVDLIVEPFRGDLQWITVSPNSSFIGDTLMGEVRLTAPAPAAGTAVALSSPEASQLTFPGVVNVPAGATSANFPVSVTSGSGAFHISGTAYGLTRSSEFYVMGIESLALPATVNSGLSAVLSGRLTTNVRLSQGVAVQLTSSDPAVLPVPASVTVPSGSSSFSPSLTAAMVSAPTPVTITATLPGSTKTATITVEPPGIDHISVDDVRAGLIYFGGAEVFLKGRAPAGGADIAITATGVSIFQGVVATPRSNITIHVAENATRTGTFGVIVPSVLMDAPASITATWGTSSVTVNFVVRAAVFDGISVPTSAYPPASLRGTMTFFGQAWAEPAPPDLILTSNHPSVIVGPRLIADSYTPPEYPCPTLTCPYSTWKFPIEVLQGAVAGTTVTISATWRGVTHTAQLSITGLVLQSLTAPSSVQAGSDVGATITLNGASTGVQVTLSTSDDTLTVPASVTVPTGQSTVIVALPTKDTATTRTATLTASYGGATKTVQVQITPSSGRLSAIAPGTVVPGDDGDVVLYTSEIRANVTALLHEGTCVAGTGQCPDIVVTAAADTMRKAFRLTIPPNVPAGTYNVTLRAAGGLSTQNSMALKIETPERTYSEVPPAEHNIATRLQPGQTVLGTLTGTNPKDNVTDYNLFYFVGTAGSRLNISMERTDTSRTWENPDSLDPQLQIIAPDGFLYDNLQREDNRTGVDYNATIANAILPQTGTYLVRAGTTHGSGPYRLTFGFSSVAPVPPSERVIIVTDNDTTIPLDTFLTHAGSLLDARGYPLTGAYVQLEAEAAADNRGTPAFPPTALTQNGDGFFVFTTRMTGAGKAALTARAYDDVLANGPAPSFATSQVPELSATSTQADLDRATGDIPRYEPAGHASFRIVDVLSDGALRLAGDDFVIDKVERAPLSQRIETDLNTGLRDAKGKATGAAAKRPLASPAQPSTEPRPLRGRVRASALPNAVSCATPRSFRQNGVTAPIHGPLTVKIIDETPSTGQTTPNGEVDVRGIHGHRIQKRIRLRIEIKDALQQVPSYPVLVNMTVSGLEHGTLILDPEGTPRECDHHSFLWHERDAQGTLIPNEIVDYQLGTFARYVGAEPDPLQPGQVKPVWGTAEVLSGTRQARSLRRVRSARQPTTRHVPVLDRLSSPPRRHAEGGPATEVVCWAADLERLPPRRRVSQRDIRLHERVGDAARAERAHELPRPDGSWTGLRAVRTTDGVARRPNPAKRNVSIDALGGIPK